MVDATEKVPLPIFTRKEVIVHGLRSYGRYPFDQFACFDRVTGVWRSLHGTIVHFLNPILSIFESISGLVFGNLMLPPTQT